MTAMPTRGRVFVASLAIVLLGVAGCSNTSAGSPVPTSPAGGSQTVSNPSTSTEDAAARLAALDPCTLLTKAQLDQYGLGKQESGNLAGARTCSWIHPSGENGTDGFSLTPAIWDRQGLRDMNTNGYSVTDVVVGNHQARQAAQIGGIGCFVAIGVTDSSRVDVISSSDPEHSCVLANQFAKLIEPRLPGGG